MKKITKYLIGAGVAFSLATGGSYFIGENKGVDKGYELGKQEIIEKLKKEAGIQIENCEHNIRLFNRFKQGSKDNEGKRLENLSKSELDKRNTVKDLVGSVK